MAEEEIASLDEGAEEEKKGGGMMKIIILAVAVVVLGVAGFFGWQMFMGGDDEKAEGDKAAEAAKPAAEEAAPPAPATGALVSMEPFIINLSGGGGKRLVKLTMTLDVGDEPTKAEVEKQMPRIRDALILMLTSKSYEDIADVTGKLRLKKELLALVNRNLGGKVRVNAVFFTEFVIQ